MKGFLSRIKLRKPDEMEQYILFRAQCNAYYFLIAALLIWTFYESIHTLTHHTKLNLVPCALLVIATLIQTFTQLILQRNAVKDDDESFETGPFRKMILLILVIVAAAIAITVASSMLVIRI